MFEDDTLYAGAMSSEPRSVRAGRRVAGRVIVPGSKSITNRALVCAALADGMSTISGQADGDDVAAMIDGLRALGREVRKGSDGLVVMGDSRPPRPGVAINVRASGTTMRFLTAVGSLALGPVHLDGIPRMRERPIEPLTAALRSLGVQVTHPVRDGFPPIDLHGPAHGGSVEVDATQSSQFVSALMLIGPCLESGLTIHLKGRPTSTSYLRTTVEVMEAFGATVTPGERVIAIGPGGYRAGHLQVEPDASAAVYPWVAAAITGGQVTVAGLSDDSSQADMAVLDVLARMGAEVERHSGSEPIVRGSSTGLRGVTADLAHCPDGALALAVAAATAEGTSHFTGLHTLRLKETDRLEALRTELEKVGATVSVDPGSLTIEPGALRGADIVTYDDHRMAMSFAVLGLRVPGIRILDPGCVAKTWPRFWDALEEMTATSTLPVVAIDGPAGTGKTTVATAVAAALGGMRLDTGAFYRTATLLALRTGIRPEDGEAIAHRLEDVSLDYDHGSMHLDGEDVSLAIRSPEVNAAVSVVSAHPEVRRRLVDQQRRWVAGGDDIVVVEGRDIGTVVFPDARLKVYLDARPEVRAERRARESGTDPGEELERLTDRDRIDSTRAVSPLRPAEDARHIDTSDKSISDVVAEIVTIFRSG